MEVRIHSKILAALICCHCGEPALMVSGHGAAAFARDLTGRVICADCDLKINEGEDLPFREVDGEE